MIFGDAPRWSILANFTLNDNKFESDLRNFRKIAAISRDCKVFELKSFTRNENFRTGNVVENLKEKREIFFETVRKSKIKRKFLKSPTQLGKL